jgi:DNA-binding Lrp family transcriptional regulator
MTRLRRVIPLADAAEMVGVPTKTLLRRLQKLAHQCGIRVLVRFGDSRNSPYHVTLPGLRAALPHIFGDREPDQLDFEELREEVGLLRQRQDLLAKRFRELTTKRPRRRRQKVVGQSGPQLDKSRPQPA